MDGDSTLTFSYERVKAELDKLEKLYENYFEAIQAMDLKVAQTIAIADDSALLGSRANKLLNNWTNYCNPYKSYYNTFRKWSGVIMTASEAYKEWEAGHQTETEAVSMGEITRNLDPAAQMTFDEARMLAAIASGATTLDGQSLPIYNGKITINGETYTVNTDANGNVTSVTGPDGAQVYVSQPPVDATILNNWERFGKDNSYQWNNYMQSLPPDQRAIAMALAAGVPVTTAATVQAGLDNAPATNEFAIGHAEPANDSREAREAAAQENLARAEQVATDLGARYYEAESDEAYYNVVVRPQLEARAEQGDAEAIEQLAYWDQRVGDYVEAYSSAYNDAGWGVYDGLFHDGDLVDVTTWIKLDGFDSAYERQQSAIDALDQATASLPSADDFHSEFYAAFPPEV